jgi:2-polyprenyl-3-methyl-5-hydroxy-6-metoxy-1,4-benzoquinol methylase
MSERAADMDPEAVERLYADKAAFYHRFFIDFMRYGAGLRALLARGGYLHPGMRVLDAGCGTGILSRNLHGIAAESGMEGITFHAFDLTPAMMSIFERWMAENGVKDIQLRRANVLRLEELPEDWKDYDLIVSSAMLEYLPKPSLSGALRNLAGLLAPGGKLLVCISRRNPLMKWLIEAWWKSNLYGREEIADRFEEAGLRIRFGRFPPPYRYLGLWGHVIEASRGPQSP